MLGDLPVPEARRALEAALHDEDAAVRAAALRSLADPGREELVAALADADLEVRCAAAAGLLRAGAGEQALAVLRPVLDGDDPDARYVALEALGAAASPGAFELGVRGLADPVPRIRGAAAHVLAGADPVRALPPLVHALDDADPDVRSALCAALAAVGQPAVAAVVPALFDPTRSEGALRALEALPLDRTSPEIARYGHDEAAGAVADFEVSRRIAPDREAARLLIDSLTERARRRGRNALRATALLDGQTSGLAIDSLSDGDPVLVANALEALESLPRHEVVRPLLRLWEPAVPHDAPREAWLPALLRDDDPWIRDCAELVRSTTEGRTMTDVHTTLTDMERVLFLRKVSLFAELPPRDLARIAAVAAERTFADGETIAGQGEAGDEMHIVVSGRVRVLRAAPGGSEAELAVRTEGDVVGEMALITREPRMASLVADGEARTLQVGRREFEGVLRERPDTAIALIRILSHRLAESGSTG
jgi:HEAT repeat protein